MILYPFSLLRCQFGGNKSLADAEARSRAEAIALLQPSCPFPLGDMGVVADKPDLGQNPDQVMYVVAQGLNEIERWID